MSDHSRPYVAFSNADPGSKLRRRVCAVIEGPDSVISMKIQEQRVLALFKLDPNDWLKHRNKPEIKLPDLLRLQRAFGGKNVINIGDLKAWQTLYQAGQLLVRSQKPPRSAPAKKRQKAHV